MAAMKPPGPDAGRRGALQALGAGLALLQGCAVDLRDLNPPPAEAARGPASAPDFLVPTATVAGGFTLAPAPVTGFRQPPPGPFLSLISPVTAAARGADLYLVDAGHNAVFHCDLARQTLRRFLALGGRPGMKLCVMADQGVLVLDPWQRQLTRLNRDGAVLARLDVDDTATLAGAVDVAVEDSTGIAWLADSTSARLISVRPALNALVPVPLPLQAGEAVAQVTAIAAGPDALYALDAARRRVLRLDGRGRVLQSFGELQLKLPRALAVDRHRRVYVAEAQGVQVFFDGRPIAAFAARDLGAAEIRDLRIHDNDLAIADAIGARVHLFRVLPPGRPS